MIHARPDESLAAMLRAVGQAADGAAAARALLVVQRDLLNTVDSRLITTDSAINDWALARRAAVKQQPVVERRGEIVAVVVAFGDIDGQPVAALHELLRPTTLTLALAEERLVLTTALLGGQREDGWLAAAELASSLAQAFVTADMNCAATSISTATRSVRVILARVDNGIVGAVGDSDGGASADHLARLKLAAGEAFDLDGIDGNRLPPGLAAIAAGDPLVARVARDGARAAVVVAVAPRHPDRIAPAAALITAVHPRRRDIVPAPLIAAATARLPWPATWSGARRELATRRLIMALPAVLLLVPVPTSVDAAATIEPLNQRIVTAPFDGRIEAVAVQPGDAVRGDTSVLMRLDARAAQNERAEVVASLDAALAQAESAQVDGRNDEERIARLHAAQFSARAEVLALQIASATIVAPINGIVAGDDLRKRTGGPVSRGETLLTVAAPGSYRVEVRVPDRAIGMVKPGETLSLALKAQPLDQPHGTVTRIYPIAEVQEGDNIFRVIGSLNSDTRDLLPGMEGIASIHTGWTALGWWVLRAPVRWVRLKLWL